LNITVIGYGSVDINPEKPKYSLGTVVQLTANPNPGWTFTDWSGDLNGLTNPVTIIIDSNKTITAHFTQNESETNWAFVVVSDVHTSTNPSGTQLNFGQIKEWIDNPTPEMPPPAFLVITGDFPPVSTATNPSETDDIINTIFGSNFIWFPVIGNHEISDGISYFNWCRDTKFPTLPWIVDDGPTGSIGTSYSWNYKNAHLVALNGYWDGTTNSDSDHARDGDVVPALYNWTNLDLSTTDRTHKFVFIHEPAYPEHRHVGDSLDKYPAHRDTFVTMLDNNSVETLFCGHTHYYEHDTASEYPLLGNVHQITNAKLRAETGDGGHTITYVLINDTKTTYKIYFAPLTTNGYPFTFLEEWTIDTSETTINLEDIDSGLTLPTGDYRWLDVANQSYSAIYRESYNYTQATVSVTYNTQGNTLYGTLDAMNLKPNFAYQLKLVGTSGTVTNEKIGLAGRWWQEEWYGTTWTNGQNLNNKGDGSSPNPNDDLYFARKDIPDATSPTGLKYRYTGYLVFDYFITDEAGNTTFTFEANSSYHVVWKTSQRSRTDVDGPLKSSTFDADLSAPAYDVDYPLQTISLFGEWERLPVGAIFLPAGSYAAKMVLTEESFHGTGQYDGNWASAMSADIQFIIDI
jgi:uncharacterized repeat protein (TIGR02543 family)